MARSTVLALIAALAPLVTAGCHQRVLPERDTYAAQLYANRCGQQCHPPFNPRAMTPAMWEVQVAAMQDKMRAAGIAPLTSEQRATIMDYLTRNAGAH